jgi:two-component system sensor histidine kinase DesK
MAVDGPCARRHRLPLATWWADQRERGSRPYAAPGFDGRRWQWGAGVFLVYLAYPLSDLVAHHGPGTVVVGLLLLALFVVLYLRVVPRVAFHPDSALARRTAAAMVVIAVVYCVVCGRGGTTFATYLAVSTVFLLPAVASVPIVLALAALAVFVPQHVPSWGLHGPQWGAGVPAILIGTAMLGLRSKAASDIRVRRAEDQVALMAAEQERLRIARDLHDLLGHALTTVTVKAELASRLAGRDPDRAAREMAQVAELARQGLSDVRAAVAGYREVSLATELAVAREVLTAAGIRAELPPATEDVPGELRELFGWVVREGVTNAVRHSRAQRVRVTMSARSIEVADDGVGPGPDGSTGNGLRGLVERVAVLGGRVETGPAGQRGFRLLVEVPV